MKDKIAKLINVKSLVTLILTLVVAYKAIMGQMDIEQIYLMIIAFYFGTQLKWVGVSPAMICWAKLMA